MGADERDGTVAGAEIEFSGAHRFGGQGGAHVEGIHEDPAGVQADGHPERSGAGAGEGQNETDGKKSQEFRKEKGGLGIAAEDLGGHGEAGGGANSGGRKLRHGGIGNPVVFGRIRGVVGGEDGPPFLAHDGKLLAGGLVLHVQIRSLHEMQDGKEGGDEDDGLPGFGGAQGDAEEEAAEDPFLQQGGADGGEGGLGEDALPIGVGLGGEGSELEEDQSHHSEETTRDEEPHQGIGQSERVFFQAEGTAGDAHPLQERPEEPEGGDEERAVIITVELVDGEFVGQPAEHGGLSLFETDEKGGQPLAAGIQDRGEERPEEEDTGEIERDFEDRSGAAGGWGCGEGGGHGRGRVFSAFRSMD